MHCILPVGFRIHPRQDHCREFTKETRERQNYDRQYVYEPSMSHLLSFDEHFPTAMDTDKIKVFGARLKVDSTGKLAELERAERVSRSSIFLCLML